MNEKLTAKFNQYLETIEYAETVNQHNKAIAAAEAFILALYMSDAISYETKKVYDNQIDNAVKKYWEKAKADFISAHKRIF